MLSDHDLGFGDSVLGDSNPSLIEAAKIFRLMHLKNLRSIQSSINNTIEVVQKVRAQLSGLASKTGTIDKRLGHFSNDY